eukprot:3848875-Amphidinium_carterae.1
MGEFVDLQLPIAKWRFGMESPSHSDCAPDRLFDSGLISFKALPSNAHTGRMSRNIQGHV